MRYSAELDVTACGFDEPEYRKIGADTGSACYRANIVGLAQRRSADITRKLDAVPIIGGEILKIISRCANPELTGLLVDDIGRCHPVVGCRLPDFRLGNQFISACLSDGRRTRKYCKSDACCPEPHGSSLRADVGMGLL